MQIFYNSERVTHLIMDLTESLNKSSFIFYEFNICSQYSNKEEIVDF